MNGFLYKKNCAEEAAGLITFFSQCVFASEPKGI